MGYVRAVDVLPLEMIDQIQKYADGTVIYIPRKNSEKKQWGANTDTRLVIQKRNNNILSDYQKGMSVSMLANKYFLVEKSIKRILRTCEVKEK